MQGNWRRKRIYERKAGAASLDNLNNTPTILSRDGLTRVPREERPRAQVPQGTLDLIVMRTLATMGPQHAYGLALRLQQVSDDVLHLNQGTLYPALLRLEQQGFIKGAWRVTEHNREAKFYALTRAGEKELARETERWNRLTGLMEKLLRGPA